MESTLNVHIEKLIDLSDDALLLLSASNKILHANNVALQYLETSLPEIVSKNFIEMYCSGFGGCKHCSNTETMGIMCRIDINSKNYHTIPVSLKFEEKSYSLIKLIPGLQTGNDHQELSPQKIGLAISNSSGSISFADEYFCSLTKENTEKIQVNSLFNLFPDSGQQLHEIFFSGDNQTETNKIFLAKTRNNPDQLLEVNAIKIPREPDKYFWLIRKPLENKNTEQPQNPTDNFYSSIIKTLPIGVGLLKNRKLLFVNQRLSEITGYSLVELSNKTIVDLFAFSEDFEHISTDFLTAEKSATPFDANALWKCADGKIIDVALRFIVYNALDYQDSFIMTVIDITDTNKAKRDKERTEIRYKNLIQQAADAIIIIEANEGIITEVNEKACSLTEFEANELKGMHISALFPEEVSREYIELFISEDWTMKNPISRAEIISKHKKKILVEINHNIIADPQGNLIIGFYRDLTDRKAWEQKLADSENKYRVLFDTVQEGVAVVDPADCKVLMVNKTLCNLLGYEANHFNNKHLGILLSHEQDYISEIESLSNFLVDGLNKLSLKHNNGKLVFANLRATSFYSENKMLTAVFITDVTEAIKYEQELIQSKEKAEEGDRLKSAFLANMSHEVRTPMNAIIGFSSLLDNDELDQGRRKKYTEIIRGRCNDLLRIIDDILDISKIEAGLLSITPEKFKIREFMDELFEIHKARLAESEKLQIQLELIPPERNITINTDRQRLLQVMNNLADNALKFTLKGKVTIGCHEQSEGIIQFFIKDTGVGIPREKYSIIFHRFRQAEENLTRKFGGNGLGLAISKPLVELMGGTISFESELDKGSVFYVNIPVDCQNHQLQQATTLEHVSILLVEDDQHSAGYVKILLEQLGATITHIQNGLEAIDLIKRGEKYDLILLDIQLKDMSGLVVASKIRLFNATIPIIAETAYARDIDRDLCIEAGCNDYLAKPLDDEELVAMIAKYINKLP